MITSARQRHCLYSKASINIIRRALLIIPEKRVVYVLSIVAYQDYQDRCRPSQKKKLDFHTQELSAHAHNIVQEVEVHGWLLSGSEEDYTLLLFYDSCS